MFIAVVQENFDVTEDEKRNYQLKTFLQNKDYSAPTQGWVGNRFGPFLDFLVNSELECPYPAYFGWGRRSGRIPTRVKLLLRC